MAPAVALTVIGTVLVLWLAFDHSGIRHIADAGKVRAAVSQTGDVHLPADAKITMATMTEDPQGGVDISLVATFGTRATAAFLTESEIDLNTPNPSQTMSTCRGLAADWPDRTITETAESVCVRDRRPGGVQRDVILQPDGGGTTTAYIKLSRP
ncbi:hypothetical protein [Mycobacterium branderi]|nr:hypothetical protein [Mycobacterium branderi]MCV7236226.1 hypothetical protein [Mycobacterium branderi]BBZ15105.1 hypothetical protein MBRA_53000 [Mycobacterium branderi]